MEITVSVFLGLGSAPCPASAAVRVPAEASADRAVGRTGTGHPDSAGHVLRERAGLAIGEVEGHSGVI